MTLETRLFAELPERERQARRERLENATRLMRRFAAPEPLPVIDNASAMFVIFLAFAASGGLIAWVTG